MMAISRITPPITERIMIVFFDEVFSGCDVDDCCSEGFSGFAICIGLDLINCAAS